jgi:hypothetical protein
MEIYGKSAYVIVDGKNSCASDGSGNIKTIKGIYLY